MKIAIYVAEVKRRGPAEHKSRSCEAWRLRRLWDGERRTASKVMMDGTGASGQGAPKISVTKVIVRKS